MASRAWKNTVKISEVEKMVATVEFETTADTTTFDLGSIALDGEGVRIEAVLNGADLRSVDWTINADDNTKVDMADTIPKDCDVVFKVFAK